MELSDVTEIINAKNCDLASSSFEDVNLADANVKNTNLQNAAFSDVNLKGASIRNANLAGIEIEDSNLEGAKIDGVLISDLFAAYKQRS